MCALESRVGFPLAFSYSVRSLIRLHSIIIINKRQKSVDKLKWRRYLRSLPLNLNLHFSAMLSAFGERACAGRRNATCARQIINFYKQYIIMLINVNIHIFDGWRNSHTLSLTQPTTQNHPHPPAHTLRSPESTENDNGLSCRCEVPPNTKPAHVYNVHVISDMNTHINQFPFWFFVFCSFFIYFHFWCVFQAL